MSAAFFLRLFTFMLMAVIVGLVSAVSTPGAIAGAVVAFGYGVSEICDALRAAELARGLK